MKTIASAFYSLSFKGRVLCIGLMLLSYFSPIIGFVGAAIARKRNVSIAYPFFLIAGGGCALIWYSVESLARLLL